MSSDFKNFLLPAVPLADMAETSTTRESDGQARLDYESIHHNPSQPGPATSGRIFKNDKEPPSIGFIIVPNPSKRVDFRDQDWIAILKVGCRDVPRLMREGFYWDHSNVIKEEGYIEWGYIPRKRNDFERAPTRWYFLADTHRPRRWIACIIVKAETVGTLANFSICQLSKSRIKRASAISQEEDHQIYWYDAHIPADPSIGAAEIPMRAFNTIYDDMPMRGFWPWPPTEDESHADREDTEDAQSVVMGMPQNGTDDGKGGIDEDFMYFEGDAEEARRENSEASSTF